MKQIIAIGGGGFTKYITELKMERYLLQQCKSQSPKVCFLPQASGEDKRYIVSFMDAFRSLEAEPSWLSLFDRVKNDWHRRLLDQDIIYVGGGNTRSMLALWREWGLDKVLKEAYEKGILLCGVSAGAVCWYEQCITDSVFPLGVLEGLKIIQGSCCPHYDDEPDRRPIFQEKILNNEICAGIALESDTAAHYIDGELKYIVSETNDKRAFMVNEKENLMDVKILP